MRNPIRRIRNFAIYLPPVLLLATAGILLLGLLYYPTPSTPAGGGRQTSMVMDENHWCAHADELSAILLAEDALRQMQKEQEGYVRTLTFSRLIPPQVENGRNSNRPALIRM